MELDKETVVCNTGPEAEEDDQYLSSEDKIFHQMKNLSHSLSCGRALSHWSARNSCMSRILASN